MGEATMLSNKRWTTGLLVAGTLALAACGGGGGDDLVPPSVKVTPTDFGGIEGT